MPDLTPLEAAEKLEEVYDSCFGKYKRRISDNPEFERYLSAIYVAVSVLHRIAAGEYAPVVHCSDCKLHKSCTFEETFVTSGLSKGFRYCGAGTRKDGEPDA